MVTVVSPLSVLLQGVFIPAQCVREQAITHRSRAACRTSFQFFFKNGHAVSARNLKMDLPKVEINESAAMVAMREFVYWLLFLGFNFSSSLFFSLVALASLSSKVLMS